jgi:hypothetical protein
MFRFFNKVYQSVDHEKPSRSDEFWALPLNGINNSIAAKDAAGVSELIHHLSQMSVWQCICPGDAKSPALR